MLRYLMIALALLAGSPAAALDQASIPTRFAIPWGNSAGSAYIRNIPQASQIGITNCAASLTDGFPPLTFVPAAAGGCPPFGQDMNGILRQLSQWSRWQGAGAASAYDSSFSSSIGGYPSGAVLANATVAGCFWVSTVDANASNPDSGGANWNSSCPGGGIGGTSAGAANVQTVTATPFVLRAGAQVSFVAGFSNTGQLSVNVNGTGALVVYRFTQLGASASVGGEVFAGQTVQLRSPDGLVWHCVSCAQVLVGEIRDYMGATAPTGWFFADGTCKSQTTYADLFTVSSTTWGSCSAGNFAIADARGRMLPGNDNPSGSAANRITSAGSSCAGATIGTGCGLQNHTVTTTEMPSHSHTISDPSHSHTISPQTLQQGGSNLQGGTPTGLFGSLGATTTQPATTGITGTNATGSGVAMPLLNPILVVNKIVRY